MNIVHRILEKVMKKGTHYGTVPGCGSKMVLLKPGADVLAMTFQLVPKFEVEITDIGGGHKEYNVTCSMYNVSGVLLGQGVGYGSTMEKKYRYRKDDHGVKIENEDIADVYNTVLKMSKKRAQIDATLTVTGSADLFTQDLIDEDEPQKQPVSMPVATAPATSQTQEPHQDTAPQTGGAALTVTGLVEDLSAKTGKKKFGEDFTRYGVKVNGDYYGTFSDTIGKLAASMRESGTPCRITYTDDGKFRNIVTLEAVTDTLPGVDA